MFNELRCKGTKKFSYTQINIAFFCKKKKKERIFA